MKLVIAEKPSVGAAIAAVIGANEKRSGYFEGSGYLVDVYKRQDMPRPQPPQRLAD